MSTEGGQRFTVEISPKRTNDPLHEIEEAGPVLQWLGICDTSDAQRQNLVRVPPEHHRDAFANLTLLCAERWRALAEELPRLNRRSESATACRSDMSMSRLGSRTASVGWFWEEGW